MGDMAPPNEVDMPNGTLLKPKTTHLTAFSTTNAFEPMTDWIPAIGVDTCKIVSRNSASTTLTTQVAYQTAAVRPSKSDSWTTIDSARTGDGEWCTDIETISGGTASKYWVRFGVAYKASSGSFGEGDVWMQVAADDWGTVVGTQGHQPYSETATSQYQAFTPWIPAQFADKVKMAILALDLSNLTAQPAYQTATDLTSSADGWTTFDAAITSDGQTCTGEDAPTLTGKMWVRFGLEFHRTNVSPAAGRGNFDVSVCIRTI